MIRLELAFVIISILSRTTFQECPANPPFFIASLGDSEDGIFDQFCPDFQSSKALPLGAEDKHQVDYDPVNGMVYWRDDNYNLIRGIPDDRYTNAKPCFIQTILNGGTDDGVYAFEIDPVSRKLYWGNPSSGIHVANLDGSDDQVLYDGSGYCGASGVGGRFVNFIEVDRTNGLLYWGADGSSGQLSKGPISGGVCESLSTTENGVWGLALNTDGSILYWIDFASAGSGPGLLRCLKTADGTPCDTSTSADGDFISLTHTGGEVVGANDMVLYEGYFYVTTFVVAIPPPPFVVLKRVQEMAGAIAVDLIPSNNGGLRPVPSYLFFQPVDGEPALSTEIYFDTNGFSATEGSNAQIIVSRNKNLFRCTTITITTIQSGTAKPPEDYIHTSMSGTFTPEASTLTFDVMLPDNTVLVEESKTFTVMLSDPIEGVLGSNTSVTVTINENESAFSIPNDEATPTFIESDGTILIEILREISAATTATGVLTIQSATTSESAVSDFVDTTVDITFQPEKETTYVGLRILNDNILEDDEIFTVTLSLTDGCCVVQPSSIDIIVTNDDDNVEFASENTTVLENMEKARVTLFRKGNTMNDITVMVSTFDSSAINGPDYVGLTQYPVTIPADESYGYVDITIIDDDILEPLQYFTLEMSSLDQAELGSRRTTRVYIEDDEVEFVWKDSSFIEVYESVGMFTVPILRLGYDKILVSVDVEVVDPDDTVISIATETVNFASGVNEANVTLIVQDDIMVEATTTVILKMTKPEGGAVESSNSAVIRLIDDDSSVEFLQQVYIAVESVGTVPVTLIRRGCIQCSTQVDYVTVDSSATFSDYVSSSGTVQFDPDDTMKVIDIGIKDDDIAELEEYLILQLQDTTGTTRCQVIILDDDEYVQITNNPIDTAPGSILLKNSEFVIEEIADVPVTCSQEILDKTSLAYATLETRVESLLTDLYRSTIGFLYVDVYELYCGSIGVKFSVAIDSSVTIGDPELESTFQNSLDGEGYIDDSEIKIVPGTRITFQDVCDNVMCTNGASCIADQSTNLGICICPDGSPAGENCERPLTPDSDPSLTLAEIIGLSLGIIFVACIIVIAVTTCFIAVHRSSPAKSTQQIQTLQLPTLRLVPSPPPPPPVISPIDWSSLYTPTPYTTYDNPVFQANDFGADMATYWGANRRNLYF